MILFSEFSGDPGYLAERLLTLYSAGDAMASEKALFSSSGLTDFLVSESSGRRRTSSIRLDWSQIQFEKKTKKLNCKSCAFFHSMLEFFSGTLEPRLA